MSQSNVADWRLFQLFLLVSLSLGLFYPLISYSGLIDMSCPFAAVGSGLCPSCGLSRAWYLLYHGEFRLAHEANPNAYKLLLFLLIQIVWRGLLLLKIPKSRQVLFWDIIITLITTVVLAGPYLMDLIHFTFSGIRAA